MEGTSQVYKLVDECLIYVFKFCLIGLAVKQEERGCENIQRGITGLN